MAERGIFFSDDLDVCPYNPSHSILRTRMQTHLVKCRKDHHDEEKKFCPFNSTHHIDAKDFEYHVSTCPDRRTLDNFKYIMGPETLAPNILPVENREIPCDENWDDVDVPTYNPAHHLENGNLLVQIKGATPSERKKFREERRLRFIAENSTPEQHTHELSDDDDDIEVIESVAKKDVQAADKNERLLKKVEPLASHTIVTENKKRVSELSRQDIDYENAAWGWQNSDSKKAYECEQNREKEEENWAKYDRFDGYLNLNILNDRFTNADFQLVSNKKYENFSNVDRNFIGRTPKDSNNCQQQVCHSKGETGRENYSSVLQYKNTHHEMTNKNSSALAIKHSEGCNEHFTQNSNSRRGHNIAAQDIYHPKHSSETKTYVTRKNYSAPIEHPVSRIGRGYADREESSTFVQDQTSMATGYQLECRGRGAILQRQARKVGQPPIKPMQPSKRWGEHGSFESLASSWHNKVDNPQYFESTNTSRPFLQEAQNNRLTQDFKQYYVPFGQGIHSESNFENNKALLNGLAHSKFECASTKETTNFYTRPCSREERTLLKTPSDFEYPADPQNHFLPISPARSNDQMYLLAPSSFSVHSDETTSVIPKTKMPTFGAYDRGQGCSLDAFEL